MKRILIGLIVAAVLAAGGWVGFNLYVQHRATSEVEAACLVGRDSCSAKRGALRRCASSTPVINRFLMATSFRPATP